MAFCSRSHFSYSSIFLAAFISAKAVRNEMLDSINAVEAGSEVDLADLAQDNEEEGGVFYTNPIVSGDDLIRSKVTLGIYYALIDISGNLSIQLVVDRSKVDVNFRKVLETMILTKLAPGAEIYQDGNTDEDGQISLEFK